MPGESEEANRRERLRQLVQSFRVEPGASVKLPDDFDPRFKAGLNKKQAKPMLEHGISLLAEYQARLAAQSTHGLLVVLQAMDAAGKDGTIRHVMSGVNPQGVRVHSFKSPSTEELSHDFIWRHSLRLPARGEIGIFNRSHYEEVLVVRVHPENLEREEAFGGAGDGDLWKHRYRAINDWERYLTENGFRIVKLFLNLSKEEQRRRFLRRIDLPDHNWKFSAADITERARWDDYQSAYSEMLSHTSTKWAPWYVIPADRKWFCRIGAGAVIVDELMNIDPQFPHVGRAQREALLEAKRELEAEDLSGSEGREGQAALGGDAPCDGGVSTASAG